MVGEVISAVLEISPEDPIFNKFFRFSDIPIGIDAVSKDKCFREKDKILVD